MEKYVLFLLLLPLSSVVQGNQSANNSVPQDHNQNKLRRFFHLIGLGSEDQARDLPMMSPTSPCGVPFTTTTTTTQPPIMCPLLLPPGTGGQPLVHPMRQPFVPPWGQPLGPPYQIEPLVQPQPRPPGGGGFPVQPFEPRPRPPGSGMLERPPPERPLMIGPSNFPEKPITGGIPVGPAPFVGALEGQERPFGPPPRPGPPEGPIREPQRPFPPEGPIGQPQRPFPPEGPIGQPQRPFPPEGPIGQPQRPFPPEGPIGQPQRPFPPEGPIRQPHRPFPPEEPIEKPQRPEFVPLVPPQKPSPPLVVPLVPLGQPQGPWGQPLGPLGQPYGPMVQPQGQFGQPLGQGGEAPGGQLLPGQRPQGIIVGPAQFPPGQPNFGSGSALSFTTPFPPRPFPEAPHGGPEPFPGGRPPPGSLPVQGMLFGERPLPPPGERPGPERFPGGRPPAGGEPIPEFPFGGPPEPQPGEKPHIFGGIQVPPEEAGPKPFPEGRPPLEGNLGQRPYPQERPPILVQPLQGERPNLQGPGYPQQPGGNFLEPLPPLRPVGPIGGLPNVNFPELQPSIFVPSTLAGPLGPGMPGGHGMPGGNGMPGRPGSPGMPGRPGGPGGHGWPGTPGMPGGPGTGGWPGMPGRPGGPGGHGWPGTPGMPGGPGTGGWPGMPGRPGGPGGHGWPGMPGRPGGPGGPGGHGWPGMPGSPGGPGGALVVPLQPEGPPSSAAAQANANAQAAGGLRGPGPALVLPGGPAGSPATATAQANANAQAAGAPGTPGGLLILPGGPAGGASANAQANANAQAGGFPPPQPFFGQAGPYAVSPSEPFGMPAPITCNQAFNELELPYAPNGFSFVNPFLVPPTQQCPLCVRSGRQACPTIELLDRLQLKIIGNLIRLSGLEPLFQHTFNYTFFAPVDPAFLRLPSWFMTMLEQDRKLLRAFILQHFLKIDLPLDTVANEFMILNARPGGNRLRFNVYHVPNEYRVFTVDGSRIEFGDIPTQQGRLNIMNRVLIPNPPRNAAQYLQEVPEFKPFMDAVLDSDCLPLFQGDEPITLFIPYYKAFDSFDVEALHSNKTALRNFVRYHVVPGTWYSEGLVDGQYLPTLYDKEIKVSITSDRFSRSISFVNGDIRVIKGNIPIMNGVAHIISNVMSSKEFFFYEHLSEFSIMEFGAMKRSFEVDEKTSD